MTLTVFRKKLQVDNSDDLQGRKFLKSVRDIINVSKSEETGKETDSIQQLNKGNLPVHLPKIVLHIDDDPEDREFVRDAINSVDASFILHEAKSGQEGLEFLTEAKSAGVLPCLIILDLNMPGMNGFDTYNQIEKDNDLKAIPTVIFTTAAVFKRNQRKGNDHLPIFIKPDNIKDFIASVKKILTHCNK